jgi:hypothetical protein
MSRRQIAFVVVALASFAVSACGVSPTAPRQGDTTSIVVNTGSGMQH